MRGDDDAGRPEQRMLGDRLLGEDVEGRARDLARLQRLLERGMVDQLPPRTVDDQDAILHLREGLGVEPVRGLRGPRQVERDHVRARVEVGRALGALHPQLAVALGGDERVERQHGHAEALGPLSDQLADPAEAEDSERLAVDLHPGEPLSLPFPPGQRGVRLGNIATEPEHQRHGVLRSRDDVRLRRVRHQHPSLGGGANVDVVDPDPGATDHLQALPALDQVSRDLRGRADDQRVVGGDPVRKVAVGPIGPDVDVEVLAQQVEPGVGDLLLHQDPGHGLLPTDLSSSALRHTGVPTGTPASANTRCAAPTPVPSSTS
jgi:hypothetical protein